jgi:Secretion system C-terminal sorting domain
LFVMKANTPVTDNPVDGIDYTTSSIFGNGSNIGNNSFVIANNRPAPVTNLQPNTTYHVKVFEYNGTGTATKYMLTGAPTTSFTTQIATATNDLNLQNSSLTLQPNPIVNNTVQLSFKTEKRGTLFVTIMSSYGVVVYSNNFAIQNTSTTFNIHLPATTAKGVYMMKVSFNKASGIIRFINL